MLTYARYKYKNDVMGKVLGTEWYLVTSERMTYYPSGRHNTLIINGYAVKAKHCDVVQIFIK